MLRAVVGAPVRVADSMGKLVFYEVRPNTEHFVEYRPRHRPEAVSAHFLFGDIHATHGSENCVLAHRSCIANGARKNKATPASDGVQFTQNRDRLPRERHDVRRLGFTRGVAPLRPVQVYVRPFSMSQFPGAYENQRCKAQRATHYGSAFIAIDCAQNFRKLLRLCSCCQVLGLERRECATKSTRRVICRASCGNGITEYLSAVLYGAVRCLQCAPLFDSTCDAKYFGSGYFC